MNPQKKYYQKNKEYIGLVRKLYYEEHKEHILDTNKQYRKDNLQQVKKKQRNWYIQNKQYTDCPCGSTYIIHNKKNHEKTGKHKYFLRYNTIQEKQQRTYNTTKKTKVYQQHQEEDICKKPYKKIQIQKGFFKIVFL
jgi:hypothetical protein